MTEMRSINLFALNLAPQFFPVVTQTVQKKKKERREGRSREGEKETREVVYCWPTPKPNTLSLATSVTTLPFAADSDTQTYHETLHQEH